MPYEFYKILHFSGIILTLTALTGYLFYLVQNKINEKRKFFAILHGVGVLIILVSGFGLAARLGYMQQLPNWIYIKLAIWLCLGGAIALVKRQVFSPMVSYTLIVTLSILAAITAVTKFI
mgnify:CR=1 FL=1